MGAVWPSQERYRLVGSGAGRCSCRGRRRAARKGQTYADSRRRSPTETSALGRIGGCGGGAHVARFAYRGERMMRLTATREACAKSIDLLRKAVRSLGLAPRRLESDCAPSVGGPTDGSHRGKPYAGRSCCGRHGCAIPRRDALLHRKPRGGHVERDQTMDGGKCGGNRRARASGGPYFGGFNGVIGSMGRTCRA